MNAHPKNGCIEGECKWCQSLNTTLAAVEVALEEIKEIQRGKSTTIVWNIAQRALALIAKQKEKTDE